MRGPTCHLHKCKLDLLSSNFQTKTGVRMTDPTQVIKTEINLETSNQIEGLSSSADLRKESASSLGKTLITLGTKVALVVDIEFPSD